MKLLEVLNPGNRNLGLDVARTIAISLVLVAHSGIPFVLGINMGFLGVEVFFVLSGFLIGQIILREFKTEVTPEACGTFYINRWLRTFPLYFLVLFVKDVMIDHSFHLKHYFFIQQGADLVFFPVSWSLAIEEWFYILIPLVFLVNTKVFRLHSVGFIISLMLLVMLSRFIYAYQSAPDFDLNIRKFTPLRFDALLTGVLFSMIKVNYADKYEKLSDARALLFSAVLFVAGYFIYRRYVLLELSVPAGLVKSLFQTLVFVFFSFSFGFMIIWLERCAINKLDKKNIIARIFTAISVLTYAIYLIHYDIFKHLIQSAPFTKQWTIELLLASGAIIAIATILHITLEKPVMDYRKTLVKKLFANKRPATSQ